MANTTGKKFGGRQKGTPNKATVEVQQMLEERGMNPFDGLTVFAKGITPCMLCDEDGKVSVVQYYKEAAVKMPEMFHSWEPDQLNESRFKCPLCRGTKDRPVAEANQLRSLTELAQYIAPKRKAIEHSGAVGMTHEEKLKELE